MTGEGKNPMRRRIVCLSVLALATALLAAAAPAALAAQKFVEFTVPTCQ